MARKNKNLYLFLILFIISFFINLNKVSAATLNFSPSSGTYDIGDVIKIEISVSSAQSINAISGNVFFPNDILSLSSLSKDSSIINLWTHEPSFSGNNGLINFEGVIFNGYSGKNGNIITLFFNVKSEGTAILKFSDVSILANDGKGTDIFSGKVTNGNINVKEKIKINKRESIISCLPENKFGSNLEAGDSKIKSNIVCVAMNATKKIREIEISNDLISNSLLVAVIIIFVIIISVIIIYFFLLIFRLKRYFRFTLLKIESLISKNFNKLEKDANFKKRDQKDPKNDTINVDTKEVKKIIIEEIEEIKKEI